MAERRLLHPQLNVFNKVFLFFVIRSEGQRLSIKISLISVADNDLQTGGGGGGGHPDPEIRGPPSPGSPTAFYEEIHSLSFCTFVLARD